ncbi:hypothetical protein BH11BAC2_BH11BAC2_18720 [soil metagenome]
MSSNLVFDLPTKLNKNNLHYFIERIRNEKPTSVLFDWSECSDADNIALCLFINLSYECKQNNAKIRHTSHEKNQYYRLSIFPLISYTVNVLGVQESDLGVFIASVDKAEAILSRVMSMQKYLRSLSPLDGLNINPLETIFSELYMNICQHSCSNGIVLVTIEPENNIIEMIISDIGVGIPINIKESFSEYGDKSDAEAILYATEDLVTTKSIEQNYGRGLSTLRTSVISLKGFAAIFSGNGGLLIDEHGILFESYDQYQNGTQIQIRIDFCNFESQVNSDFTEDVTF